MTEVYCAGNGQLDQMQLHSFVNTLDCMHDQKIILIREAAPLVLNSSGGGISTAYSKLLERHRNKKRRGERVHWNLLVRNMCFAV